MNDIDRALADISTIRSQVAANTLFRGFGPTVMAITGLLAVATAGAQTIWAKELAGDPFTFLTVWTVTAMIAAVLTGAEMWARSRRRHGGLADAMIANAIEQFLPAGFAGAVIAGVLLVFAPDAVWMIPGLWQILVALGIFASVRSMPRTIALVGAWYFVAGVAVLIIASFEQRLTPWAMGAPFAVGQILMASVLYLASDEDHGDAV